ncbi:MAG: 4-hydroxy-tetrahydrodipicolinate synthase [Thermogemmata sp.]|uniref:4-hydroxy-tetrahydrodipicolinate synthase n=1 Tax=Thermogemmata fonticola TaxID=2755323 RepID=A0A7V9AAQ7_9BACT|nr:4-hydroxy-tetrahydrodipicolinate synthase [Thermogemmata fonticola]MBA2225381.1 4-hydroxy-tetrahydrodipicolinate synthase [Thermogemmata fonticola]MCX8138771.1 4-hydroxy-tetrahydrodipicolinate synthase [Gemmataceae bacterium]GIW84762.1 MAG: 4-hydroxy-tetrahydrodipicolinate synthase [Gemmataceae bacterium]
MATTRGEMFAGVTVALVTPFRNGEIDWSELGRLVDWHCEQGTPALAPCGTTGESPTLSHEEHERVVAYVCERARGRLKVMAGTGSNCTAEAIRMTKAAKKAGADGTLQVGPYYNKPTQEGYYRHFAAIAEAVDLPMVLYNIPGRTGSNILPETIARLAQAFPHVVAVKEASGSLDQASQIAALCDLTLLSGDDSLTLPLMSIGGRGVVSVVGNIVPQDMMALVHAFNRGQIAEAQRWHHKLFPLCRDMLSVATNPIPIKTAMKLLGRGTGELRLPMCPLDAAGEQRIRQTLINYGLL